MNANEYQKLALRTESRPVVLHLNATPSSQHRAAYERLLHAAMGMQTETGEFADPLKKALFYGKSIDHVNMCEEIGDLLWYIAIACDALGTTIEAEMQRNINKLSARYPDKFSDHYANNRDLTRERAVLEGD